MFQSKRSNSAATDRNEIPIRNASWPSGRSLAAIGLRKSTWPRKSTESTKQRRLCAGGDSQGIGDDCLNSTFLVLWPLCLFVAINCRFQVALRFPVSTLLRRRNACLGHSTNQRSPFAWLDWLGQTVMSAGSAEGAHAAKEETKSAQTRAIRQWRPGVPPAQRVRRPFCRRLRRLSRRDACPYIQVRHSSFFQVLVHPVQHSLPHVGRVFVAYTATDHALELVLLAVKFVGFAHR